MPVFMPEFALRVNRRLDGAVGDCRLAIIAAGRILALGAPGEIKARARSAQAPEPTMEEAFISLIQGADAPRARP